jgi:hypothetical protein
MRTTISKTVALGLAALFMLSACARPDEPLPVEESEPTVEEEVEVVEEPFRHPLTGVVMEESALAGPAIMAKIDHQNRPYVNLHRADVVIQQLIPQNGTRYLAIWHSDVPETVGYVRSFRPHDLYMASPLQGVLASSGMFALVVPFWEQLTDAGVTQYVWDYRGADDRDYWATVDKDYAMANSVTFSAKAVQDAHADIAPPQQLFNYANSVEESSAVVGGEPVSEFITYFSESSTNDYMTAVWEWDAQSGLFKKVFINGEPVMSVEVPLASAQEGTQLAVTNLVAISVEHDDFVGQPTARLLNGGGPAWVATGGKVIEADWKSGALGESIYLYDHDDPILLAPGKTWVMFFPSTASTARTANWGGPGDVAYQCEATC